MRGVNRRNGNRGGGGDGEWEGMGVRIQGNRGKRVTRWRGEIGLGMLRECVTTI